MHAERERRYEEPKQLLLDAENPRMASAFRRDYRPSQEDLVQYLWREEAVDEVAFSIAENGYYEEERLLTLRAGQTDTFVVFEVNRRFAAVLLLLDPKLRE